MSTTAEGRRVPGSIGATMATALCLMTVLALPSTGVSVGTTPSTFGAYDPVFTPFYPNGSLYLDAIPHYAKYTAESGTHTIILGGSTGEWPSLTSVERVQVLQAWRDAVDNLPASSLPLGRRPFIMFHAGDVAVTRAVELAAEAAAVKADSILVVAPCIMKPATLDMLVSVLERVSSAAPSLPLYYYHYPSLYNVDFSITDLLNYVSSTGRLSMLAGVKYIDSNMTDLGNATAVGHGRYTLLTTQPPLTAMAMGVQGGIVYTPVSKFLNEVVRLANAGNMTGAAAVQARLQLLTTTLSHPGGKSAVRASSRLFEPGLDLGPPRMPLTDVDPADFNTMEQALRQNGFLP
eukprot:m.33728 g.33728  ORF g.33728 m.33728 type:complete len:348 (+) comp5052_c0_seq2:4-1047(+)